MLIPFTAVHGRDMVTVYINPDHVTAIVPDTAEIKVVNGRGAHERIRSAKVHLASGSWVLVVNNDDGLPFCRNDDVAALVGAVANAIDPVEGPRGVRT